jgi:hypothetical protein
MFPIADHVNTLVNKNEVNCNLTASLLIFSTFITPTQNLQKTILPRPSFDYYIMTDL